MEIFGHSDALDVLRGALASGRMHHAWILAGRVGIGKRTVAQALAKVMLDPDATPDQLGTAPALASDIATHIKAGTHPDLHLIQRTDTAFSANAQLRDRKQTSIPIDLLRERIIGGRTGDGKVHEAPAYKRPVLGHGKVFIIDEAQRLDLPGQNALLKTLEEPPPATTLILVTDRPQRLLPTIHSRCQLLHMSPLNDTDMTAWFDANDVPNGRRPWLTQWADGAPGMAQRAIDRDLRSWHDDLEPMLRKMDGGIWVADAAETMQSHIEAWTDAEIEANPKASRESAGRDGAEVLLGMLASHVRSNMADASAQGAADEIRRHADLVDHIAHAERRLHANLNRRHVLDALVASWASTV
ncbi:MAG: hypothetical protein MK074_08435 [Phycisphaerales bacterium]|nr:hypothetical protein [Phycisphaerales bacterium]